MPQKNKKFSLITQKPEILNDIPQLITDSAMEYFPLLKKADVDLYPQIALLKEYSENYFYLEKNFNHDNKAMEVIKNNPKVAKSVTNFLKGFYELRSTEVFASKEEQQTRLQKQRNRRLTRGDSDKFKDFKKPVNMYASFMNLKSSISGLYNEKTAFNTTKRIFVLFNQALPYYSSDIRCCFDLEQLFVKFERIRHTFFDNLTLLFSEELAPKDPKFLFLKQAQLHVLCAAMMWINHTKIINSDLDPAFYFVLDMLSNLLPHRLKDFMFADYFLEETDIIAIIPAPLNMIVILIEHYQNKKNQGNEENKKIDNLLNSLQTIKKCFIDKMKGNFLRDSLKQEFIFFLDKLLQFVLSTNETGYRAKILGYYNRFLPLIEQLIKLFENASQTDNLHLLNSIKIKWDNLINENNLAHQLSEQNGFQLINEREKIKAQFQQEQQTKAQAIQEKAYEKAAKILAEKKQKTLQEEAISEMKRQERFFEAQMSPFDQQQSELNHEITLGWSEQNALTEQERLISSEKTIKKQICIFLKIDPIEEIDENSLMLKVRAIALENERLPDESHTLLILCINLADNYLSRVNNEITCFNKKYTPCLEKMIERHSQANFSVSDHKDYRKIKGFTQPALKNLMLTGASLERLLTIFEMITCLRVEIENNEYYKVWNSMVTFRQQEHRDLYKSFLENLQQLKIYRESKKNAFKTSVPSAYKTARNNNTLKINGEMIAKTLEDLIKAIKKITKILAKNDEDMSYPANVFLLKEDQLREAQLQTAVIDENKVRKPIEYNRHERFRRSQSLHKLGITENDLTVEVNFARSRKMSI